MQILDLGLTKVVFFTIVAEIRENANVRNPMAGSLYTDSQLLYAFQ